MRGRMRVGNSILICLLSIKRVYNKQSSRKRIPNYIKGLPSVPYKPESTANHLKMDKSLHPCANCAKKHAPQRCPCYRASYCGPTCQKAHWGEHKGVCTVFLSGKTKEQKSKHGIHSSESLEAQYNLARQYYTDEKMGKAEKTFLKCLDAGNRTESEEYLIMSANCFLGDIYRKIDNTDLARVHYDKSLVLCRQFCPSDHSFIEYVGCKLRQLDNNEPSVDEIIRSIAILPRDDHFNLAKCHHELCCAYRINGKIDMAVKMAKRALTHVRKTPNGIYTGRVLVTFANLLRIQYRLSEALACIEESLPILRRYAGDKSQSVGNALFLLGGIYEDQCKDADALKVFKKALRYIRRSAGDKHVSTLLVVKKLVAHYMRRDMVEKILEMFEKDEDLTRLALPKDYEWILARAKGTIKDRNEIEAELRALGVQVERAPSWETIEDRDKIEAEYRAQGFQVEFGPS
jgi:tetratricopeptide (TPR) repeat protein